MDLADATTDLKKLGKQPKSRIKTSQQTEHQKVNSVFISTVDRLSERFHKDGVRLLTSKSAPRKKIVTQTLDNKAIMNDQSELGIENQITCLGYSSQGQTEEWTHQTRATDLEKAIGKKIGFDSTQNRLPYNMAHFGQSLKFDIPGPG